MKFLIFLLLSIIPATAFSEGSWSDLKMTYYPSSEFAGYYYDYCLPYLQKHGFTNELDVITNTNAYTTPNKQMYFRSGKNTLYFSVMDFFAIYVYSNGIMKSIINISKRNEPYDYNEVTVIH